MSQQFFASIKVSPQFLFGDHVVDRVVALAAQIETLLHLLAGKVLFEPLVAMQCSWNAVVKIIRRLAFTKLADVRLFVFRVHDLIPRLNSPGKLERTKNNHSGLRGVPQAVGNTFDPQRV